MDKFAFIGYPTEIKELSRLSPIFRIIPGRILETALKFISPFQITEIKGCRSASGKEISGYLIGCPLLPKQMLEDNSELAVSKIVASCNLAQKLGASIVGLGGYTSIAAEKNSGILNKINIPVTSGNTYTAYAVIQAALENAQKKNIDLKNATLAVIGATGAIGSLCARKLSFSFSRMVITARHKDKLEDLKRQIAQLNSTEVVIEEDVHSAVKNAEMVIVTTSSPKALLDADEFKPNAVVCDVSVPMNVSGRPAPEKDINIIKGGLIKLPFALNISRYSGLAENIIYGCVAETMLLTFEKRFSTYSFGKNIALEKLDEIAGIAQRHRFEVVI